ncbi:DUF735 family protein [Borreliella burgdorferi]|nr:DUF735 family protein [Borreliella burgdorferi]
MINIEMPNLFKGAKIHKFILIENKYAQKLLNELKFINSSFISINAKENIKSRYIAIWISQVLSILFFSMPKPKLYRVLQAILIYYYNNLNTQFKGYL